MYVCTHTQYAKMQSTIHFQAVKSNKKFNENAFKIFVSVFISLLLLFYFHFSSALRHMPFFFLYLFFFLAFCFAPNWLLLLDFGENKQFRYIINMCIIFLFLQKSTKKKKKFFFLLLLLLFHLAAIAAGAVKFVGNCVQIIHCENNLQSSHHPHRKRNANDQGAYHWRYWDDLNQVINRN